MRSIGGSNSCGPVGLVLAGLLCISAIGCGRSQQGPASVPAPPAGPPKLLSAWGLFEGPPVEQRAAAGVIPYDLNTPLFSDYMTKYRFVKLPPGTAATYQPEREFDFPVGTVIAKTFACPDDARAPDQGQRLLETRVLWHEATGWVGLPYIWNAAQTEAELKVAGRTMDVSWVHYDGQTRTSNYLIPNSNQCKGCHETRNKTMLPIGPKARNLNRDYAFAEGVENQLAHWSRRGALVDCPPAATAPRAAVWDNPDSGTLDDRARAWLDNNCAHCHNPQGTARNSGLDLTYTQRAPYQFGVFRAPVAAGAGSGGKRFDIVPGDPDASILAYRIASLHPGVMMPELGKRLVHEEGVSLIRQWIAAMPKVDVLLEPGRPEAGSKPGTAVEGGGPAAASGGE